LTNLYTGIIRLLSKVKSNVEPKINGKSVKTSR